MRNGYLGLVLCSVAGFGLPSHAAEDSSRSNADRERASVRLLVLDLIAESFTADERAVVQGLLFDRLRGRDEIGVITAQDVEKRAPLEADRLPTCRDELCLFDLAQAVAADFVLYGVGAKSEDEKVSLRLFLFDPKRNEVVVREQAEADRVGALGNFLDPAFAAVFAPVLERARPSWLEGPMFLTGAALTAVGLGTALGAGGYALELEYALAVPEIHRQEKARALEQGPIVLSLAAAGGILTGIGLCVVGWSAALEEAP
jgi:hypothetical protein